MILQFYLTDNTIKQNVFFTGGQNVFISNPAVSNAGTGFDYNCYFSKVGVAASEWQWKNVSAVGYDEWKTVTGQDAHSLFANPKVIKTATRNFRLAAGSPAIDAGDPGFVAGAGELDIDAAPLVTGARVDIGADELAP